MEAWHSLRRLLRRDVREEVDEELRFHLEARITDYAARGHTRAEAERMARERFGDTDAVRRALEIHDAAVVRREHRRERVSDLLHDLRITMRGLRRAPGFTATVLATLALGIGANTAVFSIVSRVLLDPLPYRSADRLVVIQMTSARGIGPFVTPNMIARLQRDSRSLADVAAFGWYSGRTYVGERETASWQSAQVGPAFFRTLGVRPLLGRTIDERDVEPGAPNVVVLSYPVWQQVFLGDPSVIGRSLRMSEADWTVIGVMKRNFAPPARAPEIWTPLSLAAFVNGRMADSYVLQAVGRMADGATLTQVRSELPVLARKPAAAESSGDAEATLTAVSIRDAMVGDVRAMLLVVMGAALLVLLLACVNVAGLSVARSSAHRREMAVRAALGAGRVRLIRHSVMETVVLGLTGGALGVVLAARGQDLLLEVGRRVIPPTGAPPALDVPVLLFALGLSLAVGVVAGLVPAFVGARDQLNATLGEAGRASTGGRRHMRLGRALVMGQMALAVILLVGAGLLGRTLLALQHADLGYDASEHVLSTVVSLPGSYRTPESQTQFYEEWLRRLRADPGVRAAGLIGVSPWNGWNHTVVRIEGSDAATDSTSVPLGLVSEGYFATVGTRLIAGRGFTADDRAGSLPVAIVSERLAKLAWPGGNPVGARIRVEDAGLPWRTVVGVMADVRESATDEAEASVYVPAWQALQRWFEVLVRSEGDAHALLPIVRRELRAMDQSMPVTGARTLDEVLRASLAGQRLPALLTSAFAGLALVLATLGVYGIVAYAVTLRTRELAIRAALGARRGTIIALVLREGGRTALVGTLLGAAVAAAGARLLAGLLYGVPAHDPPTFAVAVAALVAATTAACLWPVWRATRIDPVEALRAE